MSDPGIEANSRAVVVLTFADKKVNEDVPLELDKVGSSWNEGSAWETFAMVFPVGGSSTGEIKQIGDKTVVEFDISEILRDAKDKGEDRINHLLAYSHQR